MSKKRVLVVTLFDDNNIGNRLQNYALQYALKECGVQVTVLDNGYTTKPTVKRRIIVGIQAILGDFGIRKYRGEYQKYITKEKRRKANEEFDKNSIGDIVSVGNKRVLQMDWTDYDIAIAGSDQIWHRWSKDRYELPFYYLEFMPPEKRVAYAASFGFEDIPQEDYAQHEKGLKGMKYISCREKSGCKIVSEVIGEDVPRVLDPTLLLDASEWRKIEGQATISFKNIKKYAFIYFLGKQDVEYKGQIKNIMEIQGIENVIDFSDTNNQNIRNCGPCEFLSLIDHAEYVFTDSFHCTVFSILFEKNFLVFRRKQYGFEKMFGRIEDLLASVDKLDCIYGGSNRKATNDFKELYEVSIQYLNKVMESKL